MSETVNSRTITLAEAETRILDAFEVKASGVFVGLARGW
jgi:hypothetical protein